MSQLLKNIYLISFGAHFDDSHTVRIHRSAKTLSPRSPPASAEPRSHSLFETIGTFLMYIHILSSILNNSFDFVYYVRASASNFHSLLSFAAMSPKDRCRLSCQRQYLNTHVQRTHARKVFSLVDEDTVHGIEPIYYLCTTRTCSANKMRIFWNSTIDLNKLRVARANRTRNGFTCCTLMPSWRISFLGQMQTKYERKPYIRGIDLIATSLAARSVLAFDLIWKLKVSTDRIR